MGNDRLIFSLPLLVALALLGGGCSVMSESECLNADWRAVGEREGRSGSTRERLSRYIEACSQYGVIPDSRQYEAGYARGLTAYCTEDNGYREGREGGRYRRVCPAALEPGFLEGYDMGALVRYNLDNVRQMEMRIADVRSGIRKLEREIRELEAAQESGGEDKQESEGGDLIERLKGKSRELGRLEGSLEPLLDEKARAIAEYRLAVDVARHMGFAEPYFY